MRSGQVIPLAEIQSWGGGGGEGGILSLFRKINPGSGVVEGWGWGGGRGGGGEGSGGPPLNSEFPDVINIILCIYSMCRGSPPRNEIRGRGKYPPSNSP